VFDFEAAAAASNQYNLWAAVGIPVTDSSFISPFRADTNPSCTFSEYEGSVLLKDWGSGKTYNWYSAAVALGLSPSEVVEAASTGAVNYRSLQRRGKLFYDVVPREFTDEDVEYWSPVNVSSLDKYGVTSVREYTVYDEKGTKVVRVRIGPNDLCYGYYFRPYVYKIYRPYNAEKWRNNAAIGDILPIGILDCSEPKVLTTSLKDAISVEYLSKGAVRGYAFQSEQFMPTELLTNTVLIVGDNDTTGLRTLRALPFSVPKYIVDPKTGLKDVYDLLKAGLTLQHLIPYE
jgi:hypothetical protein